MVKAMAKHISQISQDDHLTVHKIKTRDNIAKRIFNKTHQNSPNKKSLEKDLQDLLLKSYKSFSETIKVALKTKDMIAQFKSSPILQSTQDILNTNNNLTQVE